VNLRKYTIKQQITTAFVSVSFFILLSLCVVCIVSIVDLGNRTSSAAIESLRNQTESNAATFSSVNAVEISATLQRRAAAANIIAYALSDLYFANDLTFDKDTPSYFDESVRPGTAPGATFSKSDNNFQVYTSKEVSSYYIPKTTNSTPGTPEHTRLNKCRLPTDPLRQHGTPMDVDGCANLTAVLQADALLRKQIQRSVHIDRYFIDFKVKIPDIFSVYVGFASSGMFRQYPGNNGNAAGTTPRTYDPRKRPWYLDALTATKYTSGTKQHVFGTTIITAPYQDFWSKVWMVTFAKAIYDNNSNIVAVLGIDISIKNIQDEILRVHFLETGYAVLCESVSRDLSNTQERVVVSAPNFQERVRGGQVSLKDVLPGVTQNKTLFDKIWGQSGVSYFQSDVTGKAKRYLLAYSSAKSNMFRERYTVMVVIPEEEALAEIPALNKRILDTETEVVSTVSATSVLTALVTIAVVILVTNWISNPVQAMVRIAESIVRGAAEQNLVKDFNQQEKAMNAIRNYAGVAEGFQNADKGRKLIHNEMQLLAISFLTMTSGLKRDANRAKARVIQPVNPYHTSLESEFVGELFEQKFS